MSQRRLLVKVLRRRGLRLATSRRPAQSVDIQRDAPHFNLHAKL